MILDKSLLLADGQSGTTSAASTNVIDTLAAGDAYVGNWFVFHVTTAFTQIGTTSRLTVQFQTASTEDFTGASPATVNQSSSLATATLVAGYIYKFRIPPGLKRYIRGYNLVSGTDGGNAFSAGAWKMYIVKDVDVNALLIP